MQTESAAFCATPQAEPAPLSLAATAGLALPACLACFPQAWRDSARQLLEPTWQTAVAELQVVGAGRVWALAESPASAPTVQTDSPRLDDCDVLRLPTEDCGQKPDIADIADLSSRLARWSDKRCAYWHRCVNARGLPLSVRQAFMQWITPLERRLRNELIMILWQQSLQGEILPSPAFATGHAMTLPLARWITAPRSAAARTRRRNLFRRGRGALVLSMSLMPSASAHGRAAVRTLGRLCRQPQGPSKHQIARALAPKLGLPSWAIRRVMVLEWCAETGPADVVLEALQGLIRQLPAAAWPRDILSLSHALRCLKAMNGMLCFGLFDCETWPADQPIPDRIRHWLLRELRVCHGGDWGRFAEALEGQSPRYQPLVRMLPGLAEQWWNVYSDAPDDMEQISAPWRSASPEWWLQRLPQWWARVTARKDEGPGLRWRPMFVGRRPHGQRLVRCLDSVRSVQRLLNQHGHQHLTPWLGPSLVARAQWLVFEDGQGSPCSLALLHATTQRAALLVELIAHLPLTGKDETAPDCSRALQLLWAPWEKCHWGVLARVEDEEILREDEELCAVVDRARIRVWHRVSTSR